MKQRFILLGATLFTLLLAASPLPSQYATATQLDSAKELLNTSGETALGDSYSDEGNLPETIGKMVKIVLGLLGLLFVLLMIYAGFLWFTSAGNEEQIDKAKDILKNAIIGLIIVLSAYAITTFVLKSAVTATGGTVSGLD